MYLDWAWFESDLGKICVGIVGVAIAVCFFDRIFKSILKRSLASISRNRHHWLFYYLRDEKLIFWILSVPYLLIVQEGLKWVPDIPEVFLNLVQRVINASYILFGLFIISQILRVTNEIYSRSAVSRQRPIKGYLQSIQIVLICIGLILILALILDKSPLIFVSGLGAMTAVLLLVFKDSILSLVAGIQLTSNDLLRVGDWIEMPQFNADGDVVEVALNTVKVRNWDQTIIVIPAHKFLENSFKNWRGMEDSGGRRIKRSIFIDMNSIRFLTQDEILRLSKIKVLKNYLSEKREEVEKFNQGFSGEFSEAPVNLRRLTNVGTYRAYISEYLKLHPKVHKGMTLLIRHLDIGSEGLPLEIYVFTNDTRWGAYEAIQADIFEHLLAILSEFGLSVYQRPSGRDVLSLKSDA